MIDKIKEIDFKITQYIDKHCHTKPLDLVMKIITFLGDYGIIALGLVTYMISKDMNSLAISTAFGFITSITIIEMFLKKIFKRERPPIHMELLKVIIKIPKSYSFPSGHTATVSSLIIPAFMLSNYIGWLLVACTITMAFSRIYTKAHYFSDVMIGALVGISISLPFIFYI